MNKNHKAVVFLSIMFVLVIGMLAVYANFLNDKPLIDAQNKQSQFQTLSPNDAINGIKNFVDTTTSNIKAPPPIKP